MTRSTYGREPGYGRAAQSSALSLHLLGHRQLHNIADLIRYQDNKQGTLQFELSIQYTEKSLVANICFKLE